jgi:hypothetical protein
LTSHQWTGVQVQVGSACICVFILTCRLRLRICQWRVRLYICIDLMQVCELFIKLWSHRHLENVSEFSQAVPLWHKCNSPMDFPLTLQSMGKGAFEFQFFISPSRQLRCLRHLAKEPLSGMGQLVGPISMPVVQLQLKGHSCYMQGCCLAFLPCYRGGNVTGSVNLCPHDDSCFLRTVQDQSTFDNCTELKL